MSGAQGDHLSRIWDLIERESPSSDRLGRLCRAATRALPASGVGVSLMTDSGVQGTAGASDEHCSVMEELQFTLGEGPCMDAFALRRPVLMHELDRAAMTRWPAYTPAARQRGVRAVFAFPIQVGAARLGVLDVYRDRPGEMSGSALAEALAFADAAMALLIDERSRSSGDASASVDAVFEHRAEVFQAQGMVMIQLGVTLEEAMARLRAHAFAYDRPLSEVAREVLARRLTIEADVPFGDGLGGTAEPTDA